MKLRFISQQLSIEQFDEVELPDFSVITGVNGSGKTHLLKAIKSGGAAIDSIPVQEIVYFDKDDFSINSTISQDQNVINQIVNRIAENKNQLFSIYQGKIQRLNEIVESFAPLEYAVARLFLQQKKLRDIFKTKKKFEEIKTQLSTPEKASELASDGTLNSNTGEFLGNLQARGGQLADITYDSLKDEFQSIRGKIFAEDKDYFDFLASFSQKGTDVLTLTQNDFENITPFAYEVSNEIKEYEFALNQNRLNKIATKQDGIAAPYISEERFIKENGENPLNVLNRVLEEYDCNGYLIEKENFQPVINQDNTRVVIPLMLKHKEKGYSTTLDQLSSGEKIIMAISFMIYKLQKKHVLPRVLLLDEVDSSLHPSMAQRLLDVIQNLFIKQYGCKVILVTHSPTTVALAPEDSIFVMNKSGQNRIEKREKNEAIKILTEGFATLDEGMKLLDQLSRHELSIITEGANTEFIESAIKLLAPEIEEKVEIIKGAEASTGSQLDVLYKFFKKVDHSNKVLFVWDCDKSGAPEETDTTYCYIFPKNDDNNFVDRGIENMFKQELFENFKTKVEHPDGRVEYNFSSGSKKALREHIIGRNNTSDFDNFKPLIDKIKILIS